MSYLRLLSNSMAAAAIATAYVLALVLQLNPSLPLHPSRLVPVVASVGLFYAFHLTIIFYVALVLRQLLARELFSPAWLSVGVLASLTAASACAGAVLMWRNAATSSLVLDRATSSTIVRSGYALMAAAAGCVSGHPTIPTETPCVLRIVHSVRVRNAEEEYGCSTRNPNRTRPCAKQKSGSS